MHKFNNNSPVLRSVLYVEDDPVNALLMLALFERRPDLRLQVAPTCAEALRCARARLPALLLLDLRLPDGHGGDLLGQLRALPGLRHVRAVAVTAEDLPGLNLRDFDDFWPKPLPLPRVLEQLDHWLPPCDDGAQSPCDPAGTASRGDPAPPTRLSTP
jgi:CheY-like chemotaxis protein